NRQFALNPDIGLLIGTLTGTRPINDGAPPAGLDPTAWRIISAAVSELADGTVIADFYLPHQISCDFPGVRYVLPEPPPTFSVTAGCPNADGIAAVTVEASGGVPPYDVAVNGTYQSLGGPLQLGAGTYSIKVRDAENTETSAQSVTVATPITFG